MVLKYRLFILLLILITLSCREDEDIELLRTDYNGSELKINGYYFNPENDGGVIRTYFFYENGVVLSSGSYTQETSFEEMEEIWLSGNYNSSIKETKYNWGVFNIGTEDIAFETWEPSNGIGRLKTVVRSGDILNDTTFVVTTFLNNYNNSTTELSDTFYFKQFSPKPDSTNMFIL